ncbi:glutamate--tRNA ligase [Candidatus Marifrigoribacter sp. Uisw_064]|uniref:glutamate--tRNA ligase n=1 Tax=Candidatus Marifrigoribacter sp. Uisw_064 TaxID=3230970 RepID=UPI003D3DA843
MSQKVRVRFAPSPTGPLHIGGVRTALFNYLFAKKNGGDFILRIEDTDQNRYVPGAEEYIVEAMNWLNIPFDEGPENPGGFGPYRQSERKHMYKQYADQLIEKGDAYYAFDTSDELNAHRKDDEANGKTFIYNWHNREKLNNSISLSQEEVETKIKNGDDYVIRFKMLDLKNEGPEGTISTTDIIRGHVSFKKELLDDKVLFKSDGMPTYHLANIVDDHFMKITHVIRGEEWLPSVPLHIALYQALGWESPEFAHLPLIMKPVGKGKLSKRDGDKMGFPVFPLAWKTAEGDIFSGYREDGYLPESVINFLALLGWNPGTEQEFFSLEELVATFDLDRVNKSGARFDPEKTKWFQHHYLQEMSEDDLTNQFAVFLQNRFSVIQNDSDESIKISRFTRNDNQILKTIVSSLKERATFVSDLWEQGSFFFETPNSYDEKASKKAFKEDTPQILQSVLEILEELEDYSSASLSEKIKGWITSQEISFGKVMMPLRLALVGEMKGPDVFDIAFLLGKKETIKRVKNAIVFLS